MQLRTVPIEAIHPYEKNPRKNDQAVFAVAESIRQCGYIAPIVVDENMQILAGHTRYKALRKLGLDEAECIIKEGLTEDQKKKYRLLDNKTNELAEWDFDLLAEELSNIDLSAFDFDWGLRDELDDSVVEDDYEPVLPAEPKSNLASMGIYIFDWKLLRKMLTSDMKNPDSSHDFGKDIIPTLLKEGKNLYAYKFKGYWKDVGTIDSLWEANMDLLDKNNELDLNDPTWKIYTEDATTLPQYIGPDAEIKEAFINQGCIIEGMVQNSVLFTGARVGAGAKIIDSVLMPGVEVAEGAVVQRALVADNVKICREAVVGSADSEHIELVAKRVKGVE